MAPTCGSCRRPLRSPLLAALLSVGLPGLGHWYMERRVLALMEGILGAALLAAGVIQIGFVFVDAVTAGRPAFDMLAVVMRWAPVLIGYTLADGLFTWCVSRKRVLLRTSDSIEKELRGVGRGTGTPRPDRRGPAS